MPILAREPDEFPEGLLGRPELGRELNRWWWLLYTRSNQEKELMRRLRASGISFYTPLIPRRRCSPKGRIRVSHVPLFTGYVIMYGDVQERQTAMTSNCVSRWLVVPDGAELSLDLRQIQRLVETGVPLTPEAIFRAGMRVRIRSGPMAGLVGTIIRRHDRDHLVVAVNFLQQGASILLDGIQLERIDQEALVG